MILTQTLQSGLLNLSVAFSHPGLVFSSGKNERNKDVLPRPFKIGRFFSQPELNTAKCVSSSRDIDFTQSDLPSSWRRGETICTNAEEKRKRLPPYIIHY